jgi:hypothetical protein
VNLLNVSPIGADRRHSPRADFFSPFIFPKMRTAALPKGETFCDPFDEIYSHSPSFHLPSICPSPGCLFRNDPQGLPRRSIRIHSRALYRQLSPLLPRSVDRQGVDHPPRGAPERRRCLHPPGHPERVPDSQYRRRTRRSRVYLLWDCVNIGLSRYNPFLLSGDFRKWARETGSRLPHNVITFHFFT